MVVVFGVSLLSEKKIVFALPVLFGIGFLQSKKICQQLGFSPNLTVKMLDGFQEFAIVKKLKEEHSVEGSLREKINLNIKNYIKNGSIRGFRHKNGLPVRGQRTHSNAKTSRRLAFKSKNK